MCHFSYLRDIPTEISEPTELHEEEDDGVVGNGMMALSPTASGAILAALALECLTFLARDTAAQEHISEFSIGYALNAMKVYSK